MHAELAERLFAALRDGDVESVAPLLSDKSVWELRGQSVLAGVHRGRRAILRVLRRLVELRPIHPDAYDVMASAYHATLTMRLVGDELNSDHALVVVAADDGKLDRAFHYVFDLYAFDRYFA